jgi:protein-tyrosine kinase
LYALMGLIAGLLSGLVAMFFREYFDSALHDEEQAVAEVGLPILTSIPKVAVKRNSKKQSLYGPKTPKLTLVTPPEDSLATRGTQKFHIQSMDPRVERVLLDTKCFAGEQIRMMRVKLSQLQKQTGAKVLLVTSSIPQEGKSFVASCLAGMLAQEPDRRVLLIDADLRRGNAGSFYGVGRNLVGLSELISGTATFEQVLVKCEELNLSVLTAGTMINRPAELLSSPELERHLQEATKVFDWIIVDSPPVLALSDASIIAGNCHACLFVVQVDRTPGTLVNSAIERLGRDRVCGLVMNRVRQIKSSNYYLKYYLQGQGDASQKIRQAQYAGRPNHKQQAT